MWTNWLDPVRDAGLCGGGGSLRRRQPLEVVLVANAHGLGRASGEGGQRQGGGGQCDDDLLAVHSKFLSFGVRGFVFWHDVSFSPAGTASVSARWRGVTYEILDPGTQALNFSVPKFVEGKNLPAPGPEEKGEENQEPAMASEGTCIVGAAHCRRATKAERLCYS
jgi:hypothetical protein